MYLINLFKEFFGDWILIRKGIDLVFLFLLLICSISF